MAVQKLLLSPEEVAEAISVSRSRIYGMIKAGEIPHVILPGGRLIRIHAATLAAMFAPTTTTEKVSD